MQEEKGKWYALAAGGLVIILVSAILILRLSVFSNLSEKTSGSVVSVHQVGTSKNSYYYPVVKFTAADGKIYTSTSSVSNNL
jgi:hypothetical protein